ncbi:unnamed protein product [Closterium sp. NIES-64]|nr:unnamed protein product [Closterium sp. NIES-64]
MPQNRYHGAVACQWPLEQWLLGYCYHLPPFDCFPLPPPRLLSPSAPHLLSPSQLCLLSHSPPRPLFPSQLCLFSPSSPRLLSPSPFPLLSLSQLRLLSPFPAVPAIIPITPSPALPILHICRFIPMLKTCLPLRHLLYGFRPSPHKRTPLPSSPHLFFVLRRFWQHLGAVGTGGGQAGNLPRGFSGALIPDVAAAASGAAAPLSSPPPRLSTYPSPLPPCFPSLSPVLSPPSPRLVQQQQQRQ